MMTNKLNGVFSLYKEKDISSFKALEKVKKILKEKKCGHTGTLDPIAEGVLAICVGNSTRFVNYLMEGEKEYVAGFKLGYSTDSFDITGEKTSDETALLPEAEEVKNIFSSFAGEVELIVPAFSAKKINGERAYKKARRGELVDAGTASMNILSCELNGYENGEGYIKVRCGKGTYIRSIIHEAGQRLGSGAFMTSLVRTLNGPFKSDDSITLEKLSEMQEKGLLAEVIRPAWEYLDWPRLTVKDELVKLIKNGISPYHSGYSDIPVADCEHAFIAAPDGRILAFGKLDMASENPVKIIKVFAESF